MKVSHGNKNCLTGVAASVANAADDGALLDSDRRFKEILAYKSISALILQSCVKELSGLTVSEIEKLIEADPDIGSVAVAPHAKGPKPDYKAVKQKVDGMLQESAAIGEARITYDVKFRVRLPNNPKNKQCSIIVNLEGQKQFNPGYNLLHRCMYYCCRMLSDQITTLRDPKEYDNLQKVYSIWICTNVPKSSDASNSITRFAMGKEALFGNFAGADIDLMSVVVVGLGKNSDNILIKTLSDLFSDSLNVDDKIISLKSAGVKVSQELRQGVVEMCNISQMYFEHGYEKGREEGRESTLFELVQKNKLAAADVAEMLKISVAEFIDLMTKAGYKYS